MYRLPAWAAELSSVVLAVESTRHGGISPPPYDSLNLGLYTDDHPFHVAENRRRFCKELGFRAEQLAGARQVHGAEILEVTTDGQWDGYDAFVCRQAGVFISVSVADCVPVLLVDPVARVVGAAHAGWKGTQAAIAYKTLQAMQVLGAEPARMWAYVGTCIDVDNYEVGSAVADAFSPTYLQTGRSPGKYLLDLKLANRDQLLQGGLPPGQVDCSPFSTVSHVEDHFSHRASGGVTGRAMAVIGLL